jgi:hypothetical protein
VIVATALTHVLSPTSVLGLLAVNVLFGAVGAGGLLGSGTWDTLRPASRVGPALLVGLAVACALLPPLVYIGLSPTPIVAVALAAASLGGGLAVRGRRVRAPSNVSGGGRIAALACGILIAPLGARSLFEPLLRFDAYADWSLKARLLYGHGGVALGALDSRMLGAPYRASHREYPIGLPALEALDFHAMAKVDSRVIHLQFVLLLCAFVATVWSLLRPHVDPLLLGACLCLLLVSPALHMQLLGAYADMPVACFWAAAALALALWLAGGPADRLALAASFAAGALAVKQEGILFDAALFGIAGLALALARSRRRSAWLGGAAVAVAFTAVPWQIFIRLHRLHDADIAPSLHRMSTQAHVVPSIVRRLGTDLVLPGWSGIVPLAVAAAVVLLVRRRDVALATGYLALLAAVMIALTLVYWNARVNISGLLATSAARVIIAPVLLSAVALPLLLSRALAPAPAATVVAKPLGQGTGRPAIDPPPRSTE